MTGALLLLALAAAPCVRPTRPGTQVQGEVRVCPGRYRIADPDERGVIVAAASGTRIDLAGVVLESGDSVPANFVGVGIASRGVDAVTVTGGAVRGYRFGVRLEGGRGHRVAGIDASGSRNRQPRSSRTGPDAADRLDPFRADSLEAYGGGVYLKGTEGAAVTGVTARGAQNGIALVDAHESYIADNDLSGNTGWAIELWRAAHNIIVRNRAGRTGRCPAGRDCGAAAVLLREGSDSNTVAENDLGDSDRGVLLVGGRPLTRPSVGNVVYRNDASRAARDAFADVEGWGNAFLENRADSADVGFRLERSSAATVRGNTALGTRRAGVVIDRGSENGVEANVLVGGSVGIRTGAPRESREPGRGVRIDDNVLAKLTQGIVLERTAQARVRGNLIDGVEVGLTVDGEGRGAEVTGNVFLRASGWFVVAPELAAGGNYWATADAAAAAAKVRGRVTVRPWRPASAAGY